VLLETSVTLDPAGTAWLLAVVQGLAEFLPISSSGHMVLAEAVFELAPLGVAFKVALHVGTLFAVVWAYRSVIASMLRDWLHLRLQSLIWLIVASIPAGLVGVFLKHQIEALFEEPRFTGYSLLGTAVILWFGERARARAAVEQVRAEPEIPPEVPPSLREALILGCAQAVAILPGISRSGSTIASGLMRGMDGERAARWSFLMSLPAITGAALLELPDAMSVGFEGLSPLVAWGAVGLSALVGWLSLRFLVLVLARGAFRWFALYCTLVGGAVLVLL
jgi:undecaprenyl-diphosphatase